MEENIPAWAAGIGMVLSGLGVAFWKAIGQAIITKVRGGNTLRSKKAQAEIDRKKTLYEQVDDLRDRLDMISEELKNVLIENAKYRTAMTFMLGEYITGRPDNKYIINTVREMLGDIKFKDDSPSP